MRGRKCTYLGNPNIINIRSRSGYRIGDCSKCEALNIRTFNWKKHEHINWKQQQGEQINREQLSILAETCEQIVMDVGSQIMNRFFPKGITKELFQQYCMNIGVHLFEGLTLDPHKRYNPKSPFRAQVSQFFQENNDIIKEIAEEKDEQNAKTPKKIKINQEEAERTKRKETAMNPENKSHLTNLFVEVPLKITRRAVELKKMMDQYNAQVVDLEEIQRELKISSKGVESMTILLKQCFICQKGFSTKEKSCRECSFCRTKIHNDCHSRLQNCICANQSRPRISQAQFSLTYDDPVGIIGDRFLREQEAHIQIFHPKSPKELIDREEQHIVQALKERDGFIYTPVAKAPIGQGISSTTVAIEDPFIAKAGKKLTAAYELYRSGQYRAPVKIQQISAGNFGIFALEGIPKNTLICEYAGDVLQSTFAASMRWQKHIMLYAQGKSSLEELIVAPFNCCNWGSLLNHSQDGNCESLRIVIEGKIRVILYSKKKISANQELRYNYNGFFADYSTEGFE